MLKMFLSFIFFSVMFNGICAEKTKEKNVLYHGKGAKYIFLFIGDGMGPLQRITAQKAFETKKQPELWMNSLPVKGAVNTLAYGGGITDSAASATAMACGIKTRNGILGLDHNGQSVESVAEMAKKLGWKIAIVSSVPLNHATPAGFYAHRLKRHMYNAISQDLAISNFDYFGGGSLIIKAKRKDVLQTLKNHNYILIESPEKIPQLEPDKKYIVHTNMPYVIDRTKNSGLSLADFTRLGIKHVYTGAGKTKGFFMMVEGGKIDWSGHANDGGSLVREVKAFDDAVKIALDFYRQHPKSTSIIVTADHETGGLYPSPNGIKHGWTATRLLRQKHSYGVMNRKLRKYKKQKLPFEKILPLLQENFEIKEFSPEELKQLRKSWLIFMGDNKNRAEVKILYGSYNPLVLCMQHIFSKRCGLKWTNTSHSAVAVPASAIGVGANIFAGYYDNEQIAHKLKSLLKPVSGK